MALAPLEAPGSPGQSASYTRRGSRPLGPSAPPHRHEDALREGLHRAPLRVEGRALAERGAERVAHARRHAALLETAEDIEVGRGREAEERLEGPLLAATGAPQLGEPA